MTNLELQQLVEKISENDFNRPFKHHAIFNARLKTTGGRYHLRDHHLDFNPRVYEYYGQAELIKVIKHELCHYHLHLEKRGYQHKDRDFKVLLDAVGGSRYVQDLRTDSEREQVYVYRCEHCQAEIKRKKRINTRRFACGRCHGRLKLVK